MSILFFFPPMISIPSQYPLGITRKNYSCWYLDIFHVGHYPTCKRLREICQCTWRAPYTYKNIPPRKAKGSYTYSLGVRGKLCLINPPFHTSQYMFKLIIGFALCSTLMTLTKNCGVVLKQWHNPHWLTEASSKFQWVYFLFFFSPPVF